MPTASEIAQVAGNEYASALLDVLRADSPIFSNLLALPMMGTSFLTLALTGLPTPGGVLDLNQGYVGGKATLTMDKVEAKRFGILVEAPKSSTDLWDRSNKLANGAQLDFDYMTLQARAALRAELNNIDKLLIYGTALDAKSFPGLKQLTSAASTADVLSLSEGPEDGGYIKSAINVTGTTASTASSVYSVCEGAQDVSLRFGGPQGVEGFLSMSQIKEEYQADPGDSTRKQPYYLSHGEGYLGLAVFGSSQPKADRKFTQFSVRRAFNITADSGKTLTQAIMDALIESHPDGHKPTKFLMSKRSQRQLRDDLASTATVFVNGGDARNSTYTRRPELPRDYDGIPIIASEWIYSNEAIEVPA